MSSFTKYSTTDNTLMFCISIQNSCSYKSQIVVIIATSADAVTKVKVCRDPSGDDCGITDNDVFDVGDLLYAIAEDGRDDVTPTVTWICNEDRKLENSSGSTRVDPDISYRRMAL